MDSELYIYKTTDPSYTGSVHLKAAFVHKGQFSCQSEHNSECERKVVIYFFQMRENNLGNVTRSYLKLGTAEIRDGKRAKVCSLKDVGAAIKGRLK